MAAQICRPFCPFIASSFNVSFGIQLLLLFSQTEEFIPHYFSQINENMYYLMNWASTSTRTNNNKYQQNKVPSSDYPFRHTRERSKDSRNVVRTREERSYKCIGSKSYINMEGYSKRKTFNYLYGIKGSFKLDPERKLQKPYHEQINSINLENYIR